MQRIQDLEDYKQRYQNSLASKTNRDSYWTKSAEAYRWMKKWHTVQSGDFNDLNIRWFDGALLNITENCLDRHLSTQPDKVAIIYEPNDPDEATLKLTYKELHTRVCSFANVLKQQGVKKGDRVCFYMGMVPELLIGVLASARIGAVHSVIFGGFSALSLAGRIQDCKASVLVTNDGSFRGQKIVELKNIVDEALNSCPSIKTVLVAKRTGNKVNMQAGRDLWLHELTDKASDQCQAQAMEAEDPLFILYTSGSTGKPKGLLHTTAGYMVYVGESFKHVFQMQAPEDIFWCTADLGWITGHSYMAYAPLLNGVTQVIFEGIPTYPDAGRFWGTIDKHKVTHFYTAPTAIRSLEAAGLSFVKPYKLSSLKVLGSVGEPINEEAWTWYHQNIGKGHCPIVDTWWQTETGGIMIAPLAGITPSIPAFATNPLPGIDPVLVDGDGKILETKEAEGNLCLRSPWPGMARTIYGDHERFRQTYFQTYPGKYFTGDGARRNKDGHYRITGRVDDVINVSGHRIGTAEVEDALNQHPSVVESAVVGYPHDIKGQGIYAYVITVGGTPQSLQQLHEELNQQVTKIIGPIAKPDRVQMVSGLPKTRSGKIMRRILRKVAEGDVSQLGDTSTLLNPEIVDELVRNRRS